MVINRLPERFRHQWGQIQKDFVNFFKEFGFDWKWLAWMMKFDFQVDLASIINHLKIELNLILNSP